MTTTSRETPATAPSTQYALIDEPMRAHRGSLRSKLVLSLAAMFFVFLTVDELVRRRVISPEFADLERTGAIRDTKRVLAAIDVEVDHLSDLAKQWAAQVAAEQANAEQASMEHTDADQEINGSQQESRAFKSSQWASERIEWAAVVGSDESWSWIHECDDVDVQRLSQATADSPFKTLTHLCRDSHGTAISGMTRVGAKSLVMFAAEPIDSRATIKLSHTSSRISTTSQVTRHLVVGKTVGPDMVDAIRRQTQVDFSLQPSRTGDAKQKLAIWEADKSTLVVEFQLTGIAEQTLANLFVQVPRDITIRSSRATTLARNLFVFGSAAALLLLLLLLQRIVIGPVTAIRQHSERIAEHGLDTEPLVFKGDDEVGELAGAFDRMMQRLSDTQTRLSEASRAAGRSQVAGTVIHNVGNVLTNVNSLIDSASEHVGRLRIDPLNKLAARLKKDRSDHALHQAAPDYLNALAGSLKSDQQAISELLSTLNDNVRHIHDVIRDQQRHTNQRVEVTRFTVGDVIREAIGCCRSRLDRDSVSVEVAGSLTSEISADRSLLLQVVINIIGNARHALQNQDDAPRTLSVNVEPDAEWVHLRFRDNGCGMSAATLRKVFEAHFTTRAAGSGLGLHFCANTVNRLAGSIRAESEGPGCGSTFIVSLPKAAQSVMYRPPIINDSSAMAAGV